MHWWLMLLKALSKIKKYANIIIARLDLAVKKKCDGVESYNIQGDQENSGFTLTYDVELKYNKWLVDEAHQRNLSIVLKII